MRKCHLSIGFIGKFVPRSRREISLKQFRAVRATGALFLGVVAIGVLPQVSSRFIGFYTAAVTFLRKRVI